MWTFPSAWEPSETAKGSAWPGRLIGREYGEPLAFMPVRLLLSLSVSVNVCPLAEKREKIRKSIVLGTAWPGRLQMQEENKQIKRRKE